MLIVILILFVMSLLFVAFLKVWAGSTVEKAEIYEDLRNPCVMQILVPRENDKSALAAEQMFASIHGILEGNKKCTDLVSLEIASVSDGGIKFYIVAPNHLAKFIEGQVYAQYPNADIQLVTDYTKESTGDNGNFVTAGEIEMEKDSIFPIKTFRNFEVDPLAAITGAMSKLNIGEGIWLQIIIRPVSNYWQAKSKEYITAIKEGKNPNGDSFGAVIGKIIGGVGKALTTTDDGKPQKEVVKLAPGQEEELSEIENKTLKVGFEFKIRVISKAQDQFRSEQILRDVVASFKQFTTAHLNNFIHATPTKSGKEIYDEYIRRHMEDGQDILNIEELASVYHLPNISVETPNIAWSRARKLEPPMNLPKATDDGVTIFGETDYRDVKVQFGLKRKDRQRHFYLLGKTGSGKSTLFKNMFISDVLSGDGACFVDPHGDTVEDLLQYIPPNRVEDVVYFNPTDVEYPIGFNLLELKDKSQRDLIADGVVEVFKKQFGDSWGPRLQYILTNAVATALEAQGTTLLAVTRILTDNNYRKFILKQVHDPILYKFWTDEFSKMAQNSKLLSEAVSPIQNKVGRFIASAVTRNIIGQVKSTIDLREIMDNKKILLVNLAQGKLGEETASLLGGMIITRLQATAMERVDIPEEEREDFFLYVDEFQNFATESFAKILSEARKYKLNLTMTNQYIDQLPLTVRQAIFGNVGTLGSFVVSQSDAAILEKEFAPMVTAGDLVSLDAYSMYIKLCIDGMTSVPFSAKSLPIRYERFGLRDEIVNFSRTKYGRSKEEIEAKISKWSNQSYSEKGNRSISLNNQKKQEEVEEVVSKEVSADTHQ
ncbi:MAG TPA: type IV secretion system DNA-binding domain-containing protein [Candidatus Dojkabacteria bacterium]|nr:type IV secretion system DNA-binding domain-containing protein [Candidatus Dojkabacteria bacterium]